MQRRNYLKVLGGVGTTVGIGGIGSMAMTGGATAKISGFSISNKKITTDNGKLNNIKVKAKGHWQYDGIDVPKGHSLAGVRIGLNLHNPNSAHAQGYNTATQWIPIKNGKLSSSGKFNLGWNSLPFGEHYFYNLSDFEEQKDGKTKKTPVTAYLWMEVVEDGKSGGSLLNDTGGKSRPGVGPSKKTQFTVTVTNEPKTGSVSGSGKVKINGSK